MSDEIISRWRELENLPTVMPGEVVPEHSTHLGLYSPDGQFISDARDWEQFEYLLAQKEDHHFTTTLTIGEHVLRLSTVWLVINHAYLGGPPLIWETMMTSDGEWSDFQTRYSTRAAALNGHLTLIRSLTSAGLVVTDHHGFEMPEAPE